MSSRRARGSSFRPDPPWPARPAATLNGTAPPDGSVQVGVIVAVSCRDALAAAREQAAPPARRGAGPVDGPDVDELARLLNQVVFAPGTATADQAERAATIATDYVGALRAARPGWRRLLWSVHPGPLRRAVRS